MMNGSAIRTGACFHWNENPRTSAPRDIFQKEFSMSKFAIGDRVDKATDDHEGGVVVAVFPTDDGNFRYAVGVRTYRDRGGVAQKPLKYTIVHSAPEPKPDLCVEYAALGYRG